MLLALLHWIWSILAKTRAITYHNTGFISDGADELDVQGDLEEQNRWDR